MRALSTRQIATAIAFASAFALSACGDSGTPHQYEPKPPSSVFCTSNPQINNDFRHARSDLDRLARDVLTEALGGDRLARATTDVIIGKGMQHARCP